MYLHKACQSRSGSDVVWTVMQIFIGQESIHRKKISPWRQIVTHPPWDGTLLVAESPGPRPYTHLPVTQPVLCLSLTHTHTPKYCVFIPSRNPVVQKQPTHF